jgi:hypothetical protein
VGNVKYGDREVEYTTIGPDHEVIQAQFAGQGRTLHGRVLHGWGGNRAEAVIDLLRAERDTRYAGGRS